jgi:hypothetical protein
LHLHLLRGQKAGLSAQRKLTQPKLYICRTADSSVFIAAITLGSYRR